MSRKKEMSIKMFIICELFKLLIFFEIISAKVLSKYRDSYALCFTLNEHAGPLNSEVHLHLIDSFIVQIPLFMHRSKEQVMSVSMTSIKDCSTYLYSSMNL